MGIYSLEKRRMHGELIEMNKIRTQRKRNSGQSQIFSACLVHKRIKRTFTEAFYDETFFLNKIIDDYNRLPQYVIDSSSVNVFKMKRGKIWTSFNKFVIFISLSCLLKQPKMITFTFYVTAYVICVCIRFWCWYNKPNRQLILCNSRRISGGLKTSGKYIWFRE